MSKYVPDISSRRWVLISPQRLGRPGVNDKKYHCPFCPGHEKETTPSILRYGPGKPNTPGWRLRVIPNKFPITDIHEIFIHSPSHDKDIESLPLPQIELIIKAYRDRYNTHKKRGQVMIFCNHGEHAGASLDHPHSQLVVLPNQINIDTLAKEPILNLVKENKFYILYCPDFSQWPYEVWIAPKKDGTVFGDITDDEITDLSEILHNIIKKLAHLYNKHRVSRLPFGYNYYIYPKENWYLRVIPRYVHRAGFELGTGLQVNIIDPKDAAEELRK
jgi:UDPglucose--hexose-1-phosphate uridylyltransferase